GIMPRGRSNLSPASGIPNDNVPTLRRGCDLMTVRAEGRIVKRATFAVDLRNLQAAREIPDMSDAILAAGHQARAIGAERGKCWGMLVAERLRQYTIEVPEARGAVMRCAKKQIACG